MNFEATAVTPDELNAKLASFIAKVESDRDASLAVIGRVSVRTR
ncbi:hypothetical protein [Burkholderia contaminans]|nr:hypothetical protein [Burkholderia contaminans]